MTLQNKALNIIGGINPIEDATPLHFKFKILKIGKLHKLQISKIVHAHFNNELPVNYLIASKKS